MRLFFAAWPPRQTAAALHAWSRALDGRPIAAANIHLTLAFLGDADPARAAAAAKAVSGRRHDLPIEQARYVKRNGMVWVAPRAIPPELARLVAALHAGLRSAGFVLEDRPYAAHVTLLRKAPRPAAIPPLPRVDWPVEEFLLVRSRASSEGSSYEPLASFRLSA